MELRDRHKVIGKKTRSSTQPPHIGDVVLVDEDSQQPRGQWPMAIILDLITSRDGEVRSAILQSTSGRIIQRPLTRLIPLEIKAHEEVPTQAHDQQDNSGAPVAPVRSRKLAAKEKCNELTLRQQPARAAKNVASYSENRAASTKKSSLHLSTLLMTAICMMMLSGMSTASATSLFCTKEGVTISLKLPATGELCVNNKYCTTFKTTANLTDVPLPFNYLTSRHVVRWRTIVDTVQYTKNFTCPPGDTCSRIRCILCKEFLGNPHCFPRLIVAVMAGCLSLILASLATICYVMAKWKTPSELRQRRTQRKLQEAEAVPLTAMPKQITASRMIVFGATIACLLAHGEGCQYTHTITTNNTVCSRNNRLTDCRQLVESTITLSERRPQACFRLRNGNDTVGVIEVQLEQVILTCNPVVLFYTRDVDIITESAKRCHLAGSCSSQTCSHTSRRSYIPELRDIYDFPGMARCSTSCGGLGCGCFLPTPGCLFSRSYAKPKTKKIYQVFHCPTWQESAVLKYTYSGIREQDVSQQVRITTQSSQKVKNANITLEFITMPTIPLLSSIFLQAVNCNHSEVAVVDNDDFFSLRCSSRKSTTNITECYFEDMCTCSPSETDAKCVCKNLNITSKMSSLENRLPLSSSVLHLQDAHGRVYGTIHNAVADITFSTFVGYQPHSITDTQDCNIVVSPVKGCYNCLSGAEVAFTCYSERPIIVEVACRQSIFAIKCNSSTSITTITLHATTPKYADSCCAVCGERKYNFTLSGLLAFHTQWSESSGSNMTEHANYINMFTYPDLGHFLEIAMEHWRTVIVTFLAVALLIATIALATSPKNFIADHMLEVEDCNEFDQFRHEHIRILSTSCTAALIITFISYTTQYQRQPRTILHQRHSNSL